MKKVTCAVFLLATFFFSDRPAVAQRLPLLSCGHGTAKRLQETTLERFDGGVWGVPCVFMARSAEEWNAIMQQMLHDGELVIEPALPPPDVNWKRDNVILVSLGQMPTSGYGVEIRGVNKMAGTALLDLRITVPSDDLRPQVVTFPYHLIRVFKVGLRDVEVCRQTLSYSEETGEGPSLDWNGAFENLTTAEPGARAETWGGIKARFP